MLKIDRYPNLDNGVLILGFTGWMNGGEVSTGTVDYLIENFNAEEFASIEPDGYYVYSVPGSMEISAMFRPHAKIEDGRVTGYDEPNNKFYVSEAHNCMLLRGDEPHMNWHEYVDNVFDIAEKSNIRKIFFVGSVTGMVPHTRDPIFYSSVSHESLRDDLLDIDVHATNYEGPSSLATFFIRQAEARDIPMMTLVAGIPPYVQGTNDHCIEATMEKLKRLTSLDIDMDELSARRIQFSQGLDKIIGKRPQLLEQIQKLEAIYDDQLDPAGEEPPESEADSGDLRDWFDKQGFRFDL
ncbi:MAG: PAC2 family protein [Candidatus Hydrogenedentota bacterium]